MDWIKVTPETMPPDMEPVMVTLMFSDADGSSCGRMPDTTA